MGARISVRAIPSAILRCAFITFAAVCALVISGCGPSGETATTEDNSSSEQVTVTETSAPVSSPEPEPILEEPDEMTLYALLDESEAASLIEQAKVDPDAAWVAAHAGDYILFSEPVQVKLLKLLAADPKAAPYVRGFYELYPSDEPDYDAPAMPKTSPSSGVPDTSVPHLYQWDQRWGYVEYGGCCMGVSACCPTAIAMVYQALTGDESVSPYDVGLLGYELGYVSRSGTGSEMLWAACEPLGLQCWEIPAEADEITAALKDGHPLIANVGIGYFSTSGHYFVLSGLSDDGRIILNDPYSAARSSQLWDPELIASESMVVYAYAKA